MSQIAINSEKRNQILNLKEDYYNLFLMNLELH